MAATDKVVPYFDISFQHASNAVLRKMRRFGDPESFVNLIERVRQRVPHAGIRSNFIVGFPGESVDDVDTLMAFLEEARLDAIGVFAYSDEDNTEAATFTDKLEADEIAARRDSVSALADELVAQRAEDRIGEESTMLVEVSGEATVGRVQTQGPEVDGETLVHGVHPVGAVVPVRIVDAQGADLVAEVIE
ncbi:GTP cyclohydrolase [Platysternon megacephalum]|uniref:GTP cyclohydrolase n=1 Tax=Platysternon megacephalum TaxID=55544 RepID=A0A4D9DJ54_9SAUR|nr:GTP cyclohydrolase [Platysternon megacephalum]